MNKYKELRLIEELMVELIQQGKEDSNYFDELMKQTNSTIRNIGNRMNEITENFLRQIIILQNKIMMGSMGPVASSRAILLIDNYEKALIDVYGRSEYENMRNEFKMENKNG